MADGSPVQVGGLRRTFKRRLKIGLNLKRMSEARQAVLGLPQIMSATPRSVHRVIFLGEEGRRCSIKRSACHIMMSGDIGSDFPLRRYRLLTFSW